MFIIFMDIATLATIEEKAIKFFEILKSKSQEGIEDSITNIKRYEIRCVNFFISNVKWIDTSINVTLFSRRYTILIPDQDSWYEIRFFSLLLVNKIHMLIIYGTILFLL